jgi:prophage regulatory protein
MSQTKSETTTPPADVQPAVFVRMATVVSVTGLGRSTIYRLMAEDKFPSPVRLSKRAIGWRRIDLEHWTAGRPTISAATGASATDARRRWKLATPKGPERSRRGRASA